MKWFKAFIVGLSFACLSVAGKAQATQEFEAPNVLIERLSNELLNLVKTDQVLRSGDVNRISAVVNEKILPHLDFRRMTAMTIGPKWREATEEQKNSIQNELQMMLIRTYSGALNQIPMDVKIVMLPYRAAPQDTDVTVSTQIFTGAPTPVELSYRLRLGEKGWMVYNVNVAGVWMVENYRSQFQPTLNSQGLNGLIKTLQDYNVSDAAKSK